MSKYDFELDLSDKSSTGIILSKILPGAVVLEFGCATGRMTRYMKEALGCSVYIVEYEQEAYNVAIQYADGGICGDIMEFEWLKDFSHLSFDAIIFSDVLEHLTHPEKVLQKASELLKEDGQIFVSIPNITHNDVLLKAYDDHFDYTATGLLDNSHIHFWGLKNLSNLTDVCGLSIRQLEATYCPLGHTEQYTDEVKSENVLLENLLRERICGEVYQFILTLEKKKEAKPQSEAICNFVPSSIISHIYIDTGNDFNGNEVVAVNASYNGNGGYQLQYTLADTKGVKRIKFDPVEGQSCILRNIAITQGGVALTLNYSAGIANEAGIFLYDTDPMVHAALVSSEPVEINAEFVLCGTEYLKLLEEMFLKQNQLLCGLQSEHTFELKQMKQSYEDTLIAQANKNEFLFEKEKNVLQHEIAVLRQELDAYVTLATRKEKYIVEEKKRFNNIISELQDILQNKEQQYHDVMQNKAQEIIILEEYKTELLNEIQECNKTLAEKDAYIAALEQDRDYFKNLFVVRVRTKLVRMLKGVLRKS